MRSPPTGTVVGYDPGGNDAHGLTAIKVKSGRPYGLETHTARSLEAAIAFLESLSDVLALGIDTLTCWATGQGGWRPADLWLRERYRAVASSVISPNYLSGAMGINGMGFLVAARKKWPDVFVTETHPKVLLYCMAETKHDYAAKRKAMDLALGHAIGLRVAPTNDHEWDAALSAYAALEGLTGRWKLDLHQLPTAVGERLLWPSGMTTYSWPG